MFSFYRKNISIERKHFYFTLSEQNAFLTVWFYLLHQFKMSLMFFRNNIPERSVIPKQRSGNFRFSRKNCSGIPEHSPQIIIFKSNISLQAGVVDF